MNTITPSLIMMQAVPVDLADHYWIVAGATDEVYSSKTNTYVPVTDADYLAWLETGRFATPIETEAEIWPSQSGIKPAWLFNGTTFAQPTPTSYTQDQLRDYTASVRFDKQGAGITVNSLPFATDAFTLGSLNSAYIYTQAKTGDTFSWKLPDGSFVTLDKADIAALQDAANQYVQDCYSCEDTLLDGIEAGTIIDLAPIDTAFAAITNTFTGLNEGLEVRHRRPH